MNTYPISECFGPTLQGEGVYTGQIVKFVRFAGCNFDCSWCDTKYAVNPKYEGWHATNMTATQIVDALKALPGEAGWVVLSGGNPALFLDDELVLALHQAGYKIAMETQWIPKYTDAVINIDHLTYSPKPPSSGMDSRYDNGQWNLVVEIVLDRCIRKGKGSTSIKTVIFDERDLVFAKKAESEITVRVPMDDGWVPLVLSVGTPQQPKWSVIDVRDNIVEATLQVLEMVKMDPYFKNHRIIPQLHAILWGRKRGV